MGQACAFPIAAPPACHTVHVRRAVGSYLKVVRPECGMYLKVRRAKRAGNFWYYNALRLLLVASQCTGSCREIFVL